MHYEEYFEFVKAHEKNSLKELLSEVDLGIKIVFDSMFDLLVVVICFTVEFIDLVDFLLN